MQLGTLEAGYAFCHKEGMSLPTNVKISGTFTNDEDVESELDIFVSDEHLYHHNGDRFDKINISTIRNIFGDNDIAKRKVFALMNTLFIESDAAGEASCENTRKQLLGILRQRGISLILCRDDESIVAKYMTEILLGMMVKGVYCANHLPANEFVSELKDALSLPTADKIRKVKNSISKLYDQGIARFAKQNVAQLVERSLKNSTDISATISGYFTQVSANTLNEIIAAVKGGQAI